MALRLTGQTSGYVELEAPAVAGSNTLTLPDGNGAANQVLKNSATAGTLEYGLTLPSGNGTAHQVLKNSATAGTLEYGLALPTGNGTSGQYLQTDGAGGSSWQTVASLSNAEDGAGTDFEFNSGYGSNATAYGVRAWVNFNGTGTVAIRDHGNVSSITDRGTGTYAANFTTAMPDTNFAAVGSNIGVNGAGGSYSFVAGDGNNVSTTSQVSFIMIAHNATFFDQNYINLIVVR